MNGLRRILVFVVLALMVMPLGAQSGSTSEEREKNRSKLEGLKDKPEELARIRRQALFFLALPEERRTQILDLDRKLQKEPLSSRKRLEKVLERYATWLEGLDPLERKKIKDAPDSKTRLEIIKKMRADE